MVTISVIAILLTLVAPSIGNSIANSRVRSVVYAFMQDFTTLRGIAATGQHTAVITLNSNCTWVSTVDGVADAAHSSSSKPSASGCSVSGGTAFTFQSQGYVAPSANLTFTAAASGQTWNVQVLTSGSILKS